MPTTKTIGPMKLSFDGLWETSSNAYLCAKVLRQRFNIPKTATKLWVVLTECCPRHGDAIRVRIGYFGLVRLDDDRNANYFIGHGMREEAADFGVDFYATFHYT